MIEMLGVLAIIGVLSAGGVWGYTLAMEKHQTNKFINDISMMAMKTGTIFTKPHGQTTRTNVQALTLYRLGIMPEDWYKVLKSNNCNERVACNMQKVLSNNIVQLYIINAASNIIFTTNTGKTVNWNGKTLLAITVGTSVDKRLCVAMATYDWRGTSPQVTILSLRKGWENILQNLEAPLSVPEAESICESVNVLGWQFYLAGP